MLSRIPTLALFHLLAVVNGPNVGLGLGLRIFPFSLPAAYCFLHFRRLREAERMIGLKRKVIKATAIVAELS